MVALTVLDALFMGSLVGAAMAAPAVERWAPAAAPVKMMLQKHVLTDGAKPRNRARLSKGVKAGGKAARANSEGLNDYYLGTDLQWYGGFQAGTPAQNFTVVFDTGSFSAEIPSTKCTSCGSQKKFNSAASSTYHSYGTTSTENFGTGVGVDPSDYESYTLAQVRDTLAIAGLSAAATDFNLITSETSGFLNDPFDGIVGMGYRGSGTIFQNLVSNGLPAVFSLALLPEGTSGSEITLGGIDTTKYTTPLTYIPVSGSSFWELKNTQMAVNGKTSSTLKVSNNIIFDSGTSNIVFPSSVTKALYALISPNIKPVGTLGAYGIACSEIGSITATLDFTFTSSSGQPFNLTIPPEELNVGPFASDPTMCQTLINAQSGYYILGGSVLKHYYSVWDQANARMGFSKTSS
ncbi:acid protease [Clavulina sp. PMI_390]|nr:acid protease [Clavulina sp. PMI_390]